VSRWIRRGIVFLVEGRLEGVVGGGREINKFAMLCPHAKSANGGEEPDGGAWRSLEVRETGMIGELNDLNGDVA